MLQVHFIPMLLAVYTSLLKLNQGTLLLFLGAPLTGLENYRYILFEPISPIREEFWSSLRNTVLYTVASNGLGLLLGLAAALLITREFSGRSLARTLLLLPWIVPTYVVGILWAYMWQPDSGIVNHVLHDLLHLPIRPFWLVGPLTMVGIVIPTVWRYFPSTMLLLSAGISVIPRDLYEAAEVDGASARQRFSHITLPMLRPVVAVVLLFGIIGSVYSFNILITMFGNGAGYPGQWGDLLMPMIFRYSFGQFSFGIGAAASVTLMLVALAMVVGWYRLFRHDLRAR